MIDQLINKYDQLAIITIQLFTINIYIDKYVDKWIDRQIDKYIDRQIVIQINRWIIDVHIDRLINS